MSAREYTHLLLARHGQTSWHADNRYAGAESDVDLTEIGRDQAQRLARWTALNPPSAVACSPVRRAVETAAPAAELAGLPLRIVEDLREVSFGVGNGRTLAELSGDDADMVRRFRQDPVAHPFPGAEPPGVAADRAAGALREVAAEFAGERVLVVAHNTVLRLAMCRLLDLPIARYRSLFPRLDNAAITHLRVKVSAPGDAALLSFNVPLQYSPP